MTTPLAARLKEALVALKANHPESVEVLRPLYAPSIVFRDPIQQTRGLEDFLALNRRLLTKLRRLDWEVVSMHGDDAEVFLEWTMRAQPKFGPRIELAGVSRARSREGLVVDHRDYWDFGELLASGLPGGGKLLHLLRLPFA